MIAGVGFLLKGSKNDTITSETGIGGLNFSALPGESVRIDKTVYRNLFYRSAVEGGGIIGELFALLLPRDLML